MPSGSDVVDLRKIISETQAGESHTERLPAFARPALRPYLPDPRLLRALCRACTQGSARIIVLTWRWCRAAPAGDRLLRGAVPGGVLAVAVYGVRVEGRGVLLGLAGAWLVAAAALAPREVWAPADAPAKEDSAPELAGPESALPAAPLGPELLAATVREIAGAHGWAGAHLSDIETRLGATREALLAALAEAGIEVAEQLKVMLPGGRQRNRQGVRLRDLPAGLGEAPEPPPPGPVVGHTEVADKTLPGTLTVHPQQAR